MFGLTDSHSAHGYVPEVQQAWHRNILYIIHGVEKIDGMNNCGDILQRQFEFGNIVDVCE